MNTTLLIDALVRQTTVLLAALATATGQRTPLSRVAGQVFANLVAELKAQGVGNKVIADMFGMTLRTYHHRMARLQESQTECGRSLWEAVLSYIESERSVTRAAVLGRFRRDDGAVVRGILRDLVDSRLVYQTGRGDHTAYRAAQQDDDPVAGIDVLEQTALLLLVALHRHGPTPATALPELLPASPEQLEAALSRLLADGRVTRDEASGQPVYRADRLYVPMGDAAGWQAALFDHYQAVVTAMVTKLRRGRVDAAPDDRIGGSTYHFDVWPGHPLQDEVLGLLRNFRRQAVALRGDVEQYNRQHGARPGIPAQRVITYVGQTVLSDEEQADDDVD